MHTDTVRPGQIVAWETEYDQGIGMVREANALMALVEIEQDVMRYIPVRCCRPMRLSTPVRLEVVSA